MSVTTFVLGIAPAALLVLTVGMVVAAVAAVITCARRDSRCW